MPQLLFAATVIGPLVDPAVAAMLAEVDVPDHPFGSVHTNDVAPLTPAEKNVSKLPLHTVVGPVIYAGVAGTVDIDIPNV